MEQCLTDNDITDDEKKANKIQRERDGPCHQFDTIGRISKGVVRKAQMIPLQDLIQVGRRYEAINVSTISTSQST